MSLNRSVIIGFLGATVLGCTAGVNPPVLEAQSFDHGRFDQILKAAVTEDGWVDYGQVRSRWQVDLKAYLEALGSASPDSFESDKEKIAFWLNAYNAVCMQTLIDSELPKSVPKATFFGKNIFTEETYRIGGKVRALDEIEHGILRKDFKDSRVHAALVCGASSCPRLRAEAYTSEKLDEQLDEECRRWIQEGKDLNGKRKNRLDRKTNTFYASKIFDWFQEDFGDNDAGVLRFVQKFSSESDAEYLKSHRVKVKYLTYDWTLNRKK